MWAQVKELPTQPAPTGDCSRHGVKIKALATTKIQKEVGCCDRKAVSVVKLIYGQCDLLL